MPDTEPTQPIGGILPNLDEFPITGRITPPQAMPAEERHKWGEALRRYASDLVALADRISPERKTITIIEATARTAIIEKWAQANIIIAGHVDTIEKLTNEKLDNESKLEGMKQALDASEKAAISSREKIRDYMTVMLQSTESARQALNKQIEAIGSLVDGMPDEADIIAIREMDELSKSHVK